MIEAGVVSISLKTQNEGENEQLLSKKIWIFFSQMNQWLDVDEHKWILI